MASSRGTFIRKHLHGRGEDFCTRPEHACAVETPPRTWRRQTSTLSPGCSRRNTSTDVEKTDRSDDAFASARKHLHGRGEDVRLKSEGFLMGETPPRTWRRPEPCLAPPHALGNTSTDVEKTERPAQRSAAVEKHLHGRGEDLTSLCRVTCRQETPPRTWRRPTKTVGFQIGFRNTSTDVEKTYLSQFARPILRKHLHGRGEDGFQSGIASSQQETPPRTWRRPRLALVLCLMSRNTSTDVEKTAPSSSRCA